MVKQALEEGITKEEKNFIEQILPREFRGVSGRMAAEALDSVPPPQPVGIPAKFVCEKYPRLAVQLPDGKTIRFTNGSLTTRNQKAAEYLANSMLPIAQVEWP
jgi:hypothetical protein